MPKRVNEYTTLAEFYPTPPEIIAEMLKGVKLSRVNNILDPSAGKGDLLLFFGYVQYYLSEYSHWYYEKMMIELEKELNGKATYEDYTYRMMTTKIIEEYKKAPDEKYFNYSNINGSGRYGLYSSAIEINPTLRDVLKGREINLVGDDFLSYDGDEHYDLILMNPPFSNGDEHLLKAISLAEKYLIDAAFDDENGKWKELYEYYNSESELVKGWNAEFNTSFETAEEVIKEAERLNEKTEGFVAVREFKEPD